MEHSAIVEGWLTKSPPEKRSTGPFKLFKAKWRKRWFVLYESPASQSLPGSRAALDYYKSNDRLGKKLGSIDLEHCEEVLCKLDTAFYKHVFSLRTKHKGRDRCYYLASDSEEEMMKWVDCLCLALGLKENEEPTPQPRNIQPSPQPSVRAPNAAVQRSPIPALRGPGPTYLDIQSDGSPTSQSHGQLHGQAHSQTHGQSHGHLHSQMHIQHSTVEPVNAAPYIPSKSEHGEGYIPLEDCYSGQKRSPTPTLSKAGDHRASVDSIPPEAPPAPPMKTGKRQDTLASLDPNLDLYDKPTKSYPNLDNNDNVYNIPGANPLAVDDGIYKMPKGSYERKGSTPGYVPGYEEEGIYKVPRSEQARYSSDEEGVYKVPRDFGRPVSHGVQSELYQVPPSHLAPVVSNAPWDPEGYYDQPPRRPVRENSQRGSSSSSSESHRFQSEHSQRPFSQDLYDVPKNYNQGYHVPPDYGASSTLDRMSTQDLYDNPRPTRKAQSENNLLGSMVPAPPKGTTESSTLGRYQNLPEETNSSRTMPRKSSHPRAPSTSSYQPEQDDTYDVPPPQKHPPLHIHIDSHSLTQSPPPPRPCQPPNHAYINAPPDQGAPSLRSPVLAPSAFDPNPGFYMPMSPSAESATHTVGDLYTDMNRMSQHDVYAVPPSNRPVNPSVHDVVPPPSKSKVFIETKGAFDKEPFITQTHRTRSFKRPVPPAGDIQLPTRRVDHNGSSDSDSDEDSSSSSTHDKSADSLSYRPQPPPKHSNHGNHHGSHSSQFAPKLATLNLKPPPPKSSGEVQYLDLALDQTEGEKAPHSTRGPTGGNISPTEYREIDFVKTKALNEMQKDVESKRKSSERSVDD